MLPIIWELAGKAQSEHGIRVRPMRRRQLRKDMDAFAESIDKLRDNLPEVKPNFICSVPRVFEKVYAGVLAKAEDREKLNRLLQELAWDAVTHHPLSGVKADANP